jgi:ABC-2 type transport system ATP-binding protein
MIKLENVSKKFRYNEILDHVNCEFDDGSIYLIRGKNGTGKTVLLKLLCGLSKPTEGKVTFYDQDHKAYKPYIGTIIETPIFWKDMTGMECLSFLASIRKIIDKETILEALKRVGLYDAKDMSTRKYSLGMRQRLAIAQAVMENPDVLLFDEPTNSLDDDGVDIFRKIVLEEKEKGKTIVIVSHNIEDLQDLADYTLLLKNRNLVEA